MIKAKFGPAVRSRKSTAQANEILCKVICHNLCVLVQSIYELRLQPKLADFERLRHLQRSKLATTVFWAEMPVA
jgi:hypothetical protein